MSGFAEDGEDGKSKTPIQPAETKKNISTNKEGESKTTSPGFGGVPRPARRGQSGWG